MNAALVFRAVGLVGRAAVQSEVMSMGIGAETYKAIVALRDAFLRGSISMRQLRRGEERLIERERKGQPEHYGRRAAPSSGSRQNERRAWFAHACGQIAKRYPGKPRKVRRRVALALAKRTWREARGLGNGALQVKTDAVFETVGHVSSVRLAHA